MQASKLIKELEGRITPELSGRIRYHSTRYGNCTCGRAWITVDGREIANLCTRAYFNKSQHGVEENDRKRKYQYLKYGEYSRQDFYRIAREYLNTDVHVAFSSQEPLMQAFAIVDARFGKRSLVRIVEDDLPPLVTLFLHLRLGKPSEIPKIISTPFTAGSVDK